MNCTDVRPLLSAYYDGEITPEEHNQVEKHLATCQDCRHAMAEYRAIGGGIRALPVPVPPAGLRRDVWRTIEAQQATRAAGAARSGKVSTIAPKRRERSVLGALTSIGAGWGRAIPPTAMVAAMLLILVLFLVIRGTTPTQAATLVEDPQVKNYSQTLHVQFSQQVIKSDAEKYTTLRNVQNGASLADDQVTKTYNDKTRQLTISPKAPWKAGENYQIVVDAPNIRTGVADQTLAKESISLPFVTLAYTATPTHTLTATRTSVPTSTATHTAEPTATPQVTPTGGTPFPVITTPTTEPSETDTPVPPTHVPSATSTVVPSVTPTVKATQTATTTPTPGRKGTPTATPRPGTATPTPQCNIMPTSGFGKLWRENAGVRARLGCPPVSEMALQRAAQEHFQGGYMFWRGDTNIIYVFLGSSDSGEWYQFEDTWQDNDPTPLPGLTPPSGLYAPVRGFGKIWRSNSGLRQALGWATDQEINITGAWQMFASGDALWTSDRIIRLMYDDATWESYPDTYATPTALPAHAPPVRP